MFKKVWQPTKILKIFYTQNEQCLPATPTYGQPLYNLYYGFGWENHTQRKNN